ncbi:MAG TPA: glycosyltransferase, partial [Lacipirellulaceae bacterium]|nr:glycosyltransferase [Lacipirellulaceae bacterium]
KGAADEMMSDLNAPYDESRPRLLMTAFHYDRGHSMESRLSWQRAQYASEDYDVTVICARGEPTGEGASVIELPPDALERALLAATPTYYLGYRRWHRRVYRLARAMHAESPFALVHHVSFCGYREPSDCWRLGAPFVWGPVGGTRPFPWKFLGTLDGRGAVREVLRNVVNACQLRYCWRVGRALRAAASVLAANREVACDLTPRLGYQPQVLLETGIEARRRAPRPPSDPRKPLKILWAGRLRSWKALPLLLEALATLPSDCRYTLRVLGQGSCLQRWQRQAAQLGISDHVEWAGWPGYADQLPHYDWADVFAFTSLRDTSGTGLLEALAAGAAIVGVDHQGAADIMSDDCAVRVPVVDPATTIRGLADALARLARDRDELARLSTGAIERAAMFTWDRQGEHVRQVYAQAAAAANTAPAGSPGRAVARRESGPLLFPVHSSHEAVH